MRARVGAAFMLLMLAAGCADRGGPGPGTRPAARDPDWVQLTSGEWLKGRIKSMREWTLEFDSDKLKELSLNWEDVKELHSPRVTCLLGDKQIVSGALSIDENVVTVTDSTTQQFPRSELRSITPGGQSERNYWSGNLNLGATVRAGNTSQTELTVQADAKRRTPDSRLEFNYLGNYNLVGGVEAANNDRLEIAYDRSITRQIFVRPFWGQYYHDPLSNIEHQATVSAGAGYYIFDQPHLEWDVFAGPAYQYTKFNNTEAGRSSENTTPSMVFQTLFDKRLTQRVDLALSWQGILTNQDSGRFAQHAVGTLEFKLTRVLDMDLSLIWDRIEQPQPNAAGKVPKRDDFQMVLSLGVHF